MLCNIQNTQSIKEITALGSIVKAKVRVTHDMHGLFKMKLI